MREKNEREGKVRRPPLLGIIMRSLSHLTFRIQAGIPVVMRECTSVIRLTVKRFQ